jgi:phage-related protein
MPDDVKDEVGHSLRIAQQGGRADNTSPMKGNLRTVSEIRVEEDSGAYRVIYTTQFEDVIYVLDVFKKKSRKGIATPKSDLNRIEQRLKAARIDYEEHGPPDIQGRIILMTNPKKLRER